MNLQLRPVGAQTNQPRARQREPRERCRRPFDLSGDLVDSVLVPLERCRTGWYLNQHHLITDAWSTRLLYARVAAEYEARHDDFNAIMVKAIADRLLEIYTVALSRMLEFERVRVIWGSDDMGFKTGPLISPDDMRELVLPGHKELAQMVHETGWLYILHSCGNLATIMDDLIDDVQIDAKEPARRRRKKKT